MENNLTDAQVEIVKTIIEWAKLAKISKHTVYADNGTTFSIPLKAFTVNSALYLRPFFDFLIKKECINSWQTNPYLPNESALFILKKVIVDRLEALINPQANSILTKADMKEKIKFIKSLNILTDTENILFKILSDLQPHSTEILRNNKIGTAYYKHKQTINNKIRKYGLEITSPRDRSKRFYRLNTLPLKNTNSG